MRTLLALLLFAGPLLGQAPNGWAPIENGWAEIQSTPATGTVTTTSTLVSGRVALSSGAASLTDDAGLTRTGTGTGFRLGIGTDVFLSRVSAGLLLVEDGSGNARDLQARKVLTPFSTSGIGNVYDYGSGNYWRVDVAGHNFPITPNAYDLGSSTYTARTGYFGTSVISPAYTSGPGKSGTNVAGTNNTIQAEPGTGNATGSSIIFQTPTATTSGTDAQTQATVLTLQDSGTGGTSAPQALFAAGTSVVPSIAPVAWPDEGLYFNNGAIRFGIAGTPIMVLSGAGGSAGAFLNLLAPRGIILSSATGEVFIRPSTATNTLEIGDLPSATPAAQTLTFQGSRGGTDTNTAGVVATITGSLGTGTAAPGPIAFKVGTAQASGTTQHVAATVMTFDNVGAAGTAAPVAIAAGVIRLKGYTVATLPAGTVGDTAYVTDALAPAFGVALVGGGAVVIPAFYDGANWIAH